MAIAKTTVSIYAGVTLVAGAGDNTSAWKNLSGAYDTQLNIVLTNGATGPTLPAQVRIQVANDWNAGTPTQPTDFTGPLVGITDNNGVSPLSARIPAGISAIRLIAGSNTGHDVTIDADLGELTAL